MHRRLSIFVCLAALVPTMTLSGCGASDPAAPPVPRTVPAGSIAIVGAVPVPRIRFRHWLPILRRHRGARRARAATVTFLVKAQWLYQQAEAEGLDRGVLAAATAKRVAASPPQPGLAPADAKLQASLAIIAAALRRRHSQAGHPPGAVQVARYYRAHRARFRLPAVRHTVMVVAASRRAASKARAALRAGAPWAAVARRWSVDSSAAIGGSFAVAAGQQSRRLEHAVFAAPRGRLVGPLRAMPAAGPRPRFYLFKVRDESASRLQPLEAVAGQIRQRLEDAAAGRALAAFDRAFARRWRRRTLCAPGYVVPQCRDYASPASALPGSPASSGASDPSGLAG